MSGLATREMIVIKGIQKLIAGAAMVGAMGGFAPTLAAAQEAETLCPGGAPQELVCYYDRNTHALLYCRMECP